jgi:hypothetical protein
VNAELVAEYRRQIGDAFNEHWRVSDANAKYKVRAVPNSWIAIDAFAVHLIPLYPLMPTRNKQPRRARECPTR